VWLESLEPRCLLAAVTSVPPRATGPPAIQAEERGAPVRLSQVHAITGLAEAREKYGLTGTGQTVAVVDTGIAYDHDALGGGLGVGYRVVGGWDFSEEDDGDPYDDGPAGFHGTHVAGIIGSDHPEHPGVAPEVDLVAVRVFNDRGVGRVEWIEAALRWIHDNLEAFPHPITTVNLSVGTPGNYSQVPPWATLEDELAALRRQGVFVAVAAGNSFAAEQTVGLGYPAVSTQVIPVASGDLDGHLSSFSQRDARVVVAPGEQITSTAPDYLFDFNGRTDDFVAASGTSMAAPYVAGAAVLMRQAFWRAGQSEVSQEDIYRVMTNTADPLYDPVTRQHYFQLNVAAALDAIGPPAGMTPATETVALRGTAGNDQFVVDLGAGVTLNGTPLDLGRWSGQRLEIHGGGGEDSLVLRGTMRDETVRLSPGQVVFSSPGINLTAVGLQAIHVHSGGGHDRAEFLDGPRDDLFVGKPTHSWMRGADYVNYVRGFRQVTASATVGDDEARLLDGPGDDRLWTSPTAARMQGSGYHNRVVQFDRLVALGTGGGRDEATLFGSPGDDRLVAKPTGTWFIGPDYHQHLRDFETMTAYASQGTDVARLYDTPGDDTFHAAPGHAWLQGPGLLRTVNGFARVEAFASAGRDTVRFGWPEPDVQTRPTHSWVRAGDQVSYARDFEDVREVRMRGATDARLANPASSPHISRDFPAACPPRCASASSPPRVPELRDETRSTSATLSPGSGPDQRPAACADDGNAHPRGLRGPRPVRPAAAEAWAAGFDAGLLGVDRGLDPLDESGPELSLLADVLATDGLAEGLGSG
jgi:hypothetical protein